MTIVRICFLCCFHLIELIGSFPKSVIVEPEEVVDDVVGDEDDTSDLPQLEQKLLPSELAAPQEPQNMGHTSELTVGLQIDCEEREIVPRPHPKVNRSWEDARRASRHWSWRLEPVELR